MKYQIRKGTKPGIYHVYTKKEGWFQDWYHSGITEYSIKDCEIEIAKIQGWDYGTVVKEL